MEKNPQTIEFEFPEEIIHQILSFMDEEEAARTTLVSKLWYGAWSTRPNLSFVRLSEYARTTLQRYEDLNLNIQTFLLRLYNRCRVRKKRDLVRELVLKAIKLGAIDITIDIHSFSGFVLPNEMFESQTLARLSVECVVVDPERMINKSNLKSLTLYESIVKCDFSCLSRRFPLLEELRMERIFSPYPYPSYSCTAKLQELKVLELENMLIHDDFSKSELWLQFPCLKTLVIWNCDFEYYRVDVMRIRSPSLECLAIKLRDEECLAIKLSDKYTKVKLEFDIPNIRKFEFKGYDVPHLELKKTSSREWVSDIRINCTTCIVDVPWLHSLRQLVKLLSPSRVSLVLKIGDLPPGMDPYPYGWFNYTCSGEFDDERFWSAVAGIPECFIVRYSYRVP